MLKSFLFYIIFRLSSFLKRLDSDYIIMTQKINIFFRINVNIDEKQKENLLCIKYFSMTLISMILSKDVFIEKKILHQQIATFTNQINKRNNNIQHINQQH